MRSRSEPITFKHSTALLYERY